MLRFIITVFIFIQTVTAQLWYYPNPPIGWMTATQYYPCGVIPCFGGQWRQGISMSTDPVSQQTLCNRTRSTFRIGQNASVGTSMAWAFPQHETGGYFPVIAVELGYAQFPSCFMPNTPVTVPGGAPNYDQLFLSNYSVFLPQYIFQFQALGTYDHFSIDIPVPNNSSFIGMFVAAQGIRVDPINGLIYLSDRLDGLISV